MLNEYFVELPSSRISFTDPIKNRAAFRFGLYIKRIDWCFSKSIPWNPSSA